MILLVLLLAMFSPTYGGNNVDRESKFKRMLTELNADKAYSPELKIEKYPYVQQLDGFKAWGSQEWTPLVTNERCLTCGPAQMEHGCKAWVSQDQQLSFPNFGIAHGRFNEETFRTVVDDKEKIAPNQFVLVTHANSVDPNELEQHTDRTDYVQLATVPIKCTFDRATMVEISFCKGVQLSVRLCVTENAVIGTKDIDEPIDPKQSLPNERCQDLFRGSNNNGCYKKNVTLSDIKLVPSAGALHKIVLMVRSGTESGEKDSKNIFILRSIAVRYPPNTCPIPPPTTTTSTSTTTTTTSTTATTAPPPTTTTPPPTTTTTTPPPTTTTSTTTTTTTTPPPTTTTPPPTTTPTTPPPTTQPPTTQPPTTPPPTSQPPTPPPTPPPTQPPTTQPPTTQPPSPPPTPPPTLPPTPPPTAPPTQPPTTLPPPPRTTTYDYKDFCKYSCSFKNPNCPCTIWWTRCFGESGNTFGPADDWKWGMNEGNSETGIKGGFRGTNDGFIFTNTDDKSRLELPMIKLPPGVRVECQAYMAAPGSVLYYVNAFKNSNGQLFQSSMRSNTRVSTTEWKRWVKCSDLLIRQSDYLPIFPTNLFPNDFKIVFVGDNQAIVNPPQKHQNLIGLDEMQFVDSAGNSVCHNGVYVPSLVPVPPNPNPDPKPPIPGIPTCNQICQQKFAKERKKRCGKRVLTSIDEWLK